MGAPSAATTSAISPCGTTTTGRLDDPIGPRPVAEVPARGEGVGLVAGLAGERDLPPRGERARRELLHDDPNLARADDHEPEERTREQERQHEQHERHEQREREVRRHRLLRFSKRRAFPGPGRTLPRAPRSRARASPPEPGAELRSRTGRLVVGLHGIENYETAWSKFPVPSRSVRLK